jgi:glc operon protein GlcG
MRRLMMIAGALGVALMLSTAAFAQVPPSPNNPNENVPPKVPFSMPYGQTINLDTAKKVAAAAEAEAAKREWSGDFCVAVVGPTGDLVYFERGNNCQYASIVISQNKARSAARFRRPTLIFERLMDKGAYFAYLPSLGDAFTGSRGGNPLVSDGKIIGAVGVSGGTGSQDDTISQAAAAALK